MRAVTVDLVVRWIRQYHPTGPVADCGGAFADYYSSRGLPLEPIFRHHGLEYLTVDRCEGAGLQADLCRGPVYLVGIHKVAGKDTWSPPWGAAVCSDALMYAVDPIVFGSSVRQMVAPGGLLLVVAQEAGVRRGDESKDYFRFTPAGLALVFRGFDALELGNQEDPERPSEKYVYMIGRKA